MDQILKGGHLAPPQWIQSKLLQKKQCTLYEQRKLADALLYFSRISIDDLRQQLQNKPIDPYIDSIPHSLLLLETIYAKFYLYDKHDFPVNILKPEKLLRQLIFYLAKETDVGKQQSSSKIGSNSLFDWKTVEPRARNLLRTICDCCPSIINTLKSEKRRLDASLEGLGLHGLVNFGDRTLIEVTEAVKQELSDHQHRVKAFFQKVEKASQKMPKEQTAHCLYSINGHRGPIPTKSSHQRLMNLRLSEIKCRLQRNEHLLQLIKSSLTNADLENLARILQKRIFYDQTLLIELNYVLKSHGNSMLSNGVADDPVVAQVLVTIARGYENLLALLPSFKADDSGLGDEDDNGILSESAATNVTSLKSCDDISSNGTVNQPQIDIIAHESQYSKVSAKASDCDSLIQKGSLSKNSSVYLFATQSACNINKTPSLTNVNHYSQLNQDFLISKSTQQLSTSKKSTCWSFENLNNFQEMQSRDIFTRFNKTSYRQQTPESDTVTKTELKECRIEIERLRRQLETAEYKLRQQQQCSKIYASQNGWKDSKSTTMNEYQQQDLIEYYNVVFCEERTAAMTELGELNELKSSEELQWKILLSVIVLSFRSVQNDLTEVINDVWRVLHDKTPIENLSHAEVDLQKSVVQYLLFKARQDCYSKTIKEVSDQIWETLFDYPLLKSCKKFNAFIKTCVKLAWELSCNKIRYNIEYEAVEFDADRHKRHRTSIAKNKTIKRFVWPALVEMSTQKCVYRAVVVT